MRKGLFGFAIRDSPYFIALSTLILGHAAVIQFRFSLVRQVLGLRTKLMHQKKS
jgi:hypothetical protein